jgi:glycosyltransferase involved in cell wall biosynthesis
MKPAVTVYLPTRNRAALMTEAARSVLAQTFTDFELLIVDDASEDDTPSVCERLLSADPRIRVIRNDQQLGPCVTRNLAIEAARGEFVTGIDDDDLFLPMRLRTLLEAYAHPLSLVCSSFVVERGGKRRTLHGRQRDIDLDDLLHYNWVGNQALTRRERLLEVGGFDPALPASEDYDLWTRLVERFGPARRITPASYVKREIPGTGQLTHSPSFATGAIGYTSKHKSKMSVAQLRSQRLLHIMSARKPLQPRDLAVAGSWQTMPVLLRYIGATLIRTFK